MARHGDLYINEVTGERAVVLRGDDDAPDEPLLAHLTVKPGGAVSGEHVHPALQERFRVISGELATRVDGDERTLTADEELTVSPGTPHDWWNAADVEAQVLVELTPPNPRFELSIATAFGLANSGRTDAKGRPGLLQAALMAQEFADVIEFTTPPRWLQRILVRPLASIARRRGLRAIYPELLGPHGQVEPDPAAMAAAGLTAAVQ